MPYRVNHLVESDAVTQFVALAAQPGSSGQPAMYLTLVMMGSGDPPTVTLTFGAGAPTAVALGGEATTFNAGAARTDVSYVQGAAPAGRVGRFFQLLFVLDGATTFDMLAGTVWNIQLAGSGNQTFAWVVADNQAESYTDIALPFLSAASAAVEGSLSVTGATTLTALTTQDVTTAGSLSVTGATTLTALTAQNVTMTGAISVAGASRLAGLTAQSGTITGSLSVTGATTLTALTAQNVTMTGALSVTGASRLAGLTAQSGTITGTLSVTGSTTLAGLTAQTASIAGALSVAGPAHATVGAVANGLNLGTNGAQTTYTFPYESLGTDNPAHNLRLLSHGWVLAHGAAGFWVSKDQGGSGNLTVDGTAIVGGGLTAGALTVAGARTYLAQTDSAHTHWIMAGGTQEGTNNALGFNPTTRTASFGPGWSLGITGPSQSTPFNVLTVNAGTFGVAANATASYFITASDLGAQRVKFSVRGDGALLVDGPATINGALSAPHKNFVIDHPLDPARKQLVHGCLEGPESGVYYRGEGQLSGGRAVIELPDYFEALARTEGRTVQLTPCLAGDEPVSLLAASPVAGGRFEVRSADGKNGSQRFFWEVKAARADLPLLETERVKPAREDRVEA